jgi:prepilin-type N-terminal cleavage/methylation domain-containing protein
MIKLNKEGFTLIELLVVIAIIGILASIVLVSLNDARNKGYDTEVKSEIAQIKNAMEICYDDNGEYGDYCDTAVELGTTSITPPGCSDGAYFIATTGQGYKIYAHLCSDNTQGWCADSSGVSKSSLFSTVAGGASSTCNF